MTVSFTASLALLSLGLYPSFISATPISSSNVLDVRSHWAANIKRDIWPAINEWTAIGDSYATGVGAGKYDEFRRCLRYDGAYPRLMQNDEWGRLQGGLSRNDNEPPIFNNPACSGASTKDILDEQFRDEEGSDLQYGKRPAFGKPQFATITAGGDDIEFIGLIMNCLIYFYTWKDCDQQITDSWALLKAPKLVDDIASVIDKTLSKGKETTEDFKVFVTSYAEFFNAETDECDSISWSAWADYDDKKLTKELRDTLNQMSRALNGAIAQATEKFKDQGVVYVDWNGLVDGHRFCEPGVTDFGPDEQNAWFFYWPGPYGVCLSQYCHVHYGDKPPHPAPCVGIGCSAAIDSFAKTIDPSVENHEAFLAKLAGENTESPPGVFAATYTEVDDPNDFRATIQKAGENQDVETQSGLTTLVHTLHPKPILHESIMNAIFGEFWFAMGTGLHQCHEKKARFYVETTPAADAIKDFCGKTGQARPKVYNLQQPNELILSVWKHDDADADMPAQEDCLKTFSMMIDDKCKDGNDEKSITWGGTFPGLANPEYIFSITILNQQSEDPPSSEPEPEPEPTPQGPTQALSIVGEYKHGDSDFDWLFFQTEYTKKVDCRTDTVLEPKTVDFASGGTTYPDDIGPFEFDGKQCEYKRNDDKPGKMVCGDKEYQCANDPADTNPGDPTADKGEYPCGDLMRQPVFTCDYTP